MSHSDRGRWASVLHSAAPIVATSFRPAATPSACAAPRATGSPVSSSFPLEPAASVPLPTLRREWAGARCQRLKATKEGSPPTPPASANAVGKLRPMVLGKQRPAHQVTSSHSSAPRSVIVFRPPFVPHCVLHTMTPPLVVASSRARQVLSSSLPALPHSIPPSVRHCVCVAWSLLRDHLTHSPSSGTRQVSIRFQRKQSSRRRVRPFIH